MSGLPLSGIKKAGKQSQTSRMEISDRRQVSVTWDVKPDVRHDVSMALHVEGSVDSRVNDTPGGILIRFILQNVLLFCSFKDMWCLRFKSLTLLGFFDERKHEFFYDVFGLV